jgi:hypothetical protein
MYKKEKNMKKLLLIVLLLSMGSPYALAADKPDTPKNRQAAAERYFAVAPMDSMMKDTIEKTAENLPIEQRKAFIEFMTKHVRINVLELAAVSSMVRHFTVRELNALADFYGSPEGRSAMKKFGAYMADVMPVIQQEMAQTIKHYKAAQ